MNNIIEKKPEKNEWGLVEAGKSKPAVNWKESPEYVKTTEFMRSAYGPFGRVVFTGIAVIALAAIGIWGISFLAEAIEILFLSVRDLPSSAGIGHGVSSVAGALFAACWKTAIGAIILFPVWKGLKASYQRFLNLVSHPPKN